MRHSALITDAWRTHQCMNPAGFTQAHELGQSTTSFANKVTNEAFCCR
eukprot:CAMPEP_0202879758 /NCGR_PEP_ID=MMETSP1391-20130828/34057_1 /ASSEMBLY_ACC=CAM_ASM_000867 /TAXON_ID=1034604 /ORGANISM="Chlamydomonas leiostraca, Strain SAG 11-49" /LENGTH=47 /DNA_ID= /DNA_START= /DNA_END= /DNA_ORIENTATION=